MERPDQAGHRQTLLVDICGRLEALLRITKVFRASLPVFAAATITLAGRSMWFCRGRATATLMMPPILLAIAWSPVPAAIPPPASASLASGIEQFSLGRSVISITSAGAERSVEGLAPRWNTPVFQDAA